MSSMVSNIQVDLIIPSESGSISLSLSLSQYLSSYLFFFCPQCLFYGPSLYLELLLLYICEIMFKPYKKKTSMKYLDLVIMGLHGG